jgi:hypothetical protein
MLGTNRELSSKGNSSKVPTGSTAPTGLCNNLAGLPSLELCTRTLGTFKPLFGGGGIMLTVQIGIHSAQLEPWNCSLWRTALTRGFLQREQFQSPYCTHQAMRQLGSLSSFELCTWNNTAIVLWWYPATVQIGTLKAVGILELFPLENNSNRVVLIWTMHFNDLEQYSHCLVVVSCWQFIQIGTLSAVGTLELLPLENNSNGHSHFPNMQDFIEWGGAQGDPHEWER